MRLLKYMLPLLALLIWSATVLADYDPASPPEPGVNFTLTTRCIPAGGASSMTGTATHAFGSSVRMEAYPNSGFSFVQWEDEEGNMVSEDHSFSYSMPSHDVTLIARFIYNPGSPTEPGTPEFKQYSKVFFTQTPSGGGNLYCYHQSSSKQSGASLEIGSEITLRAEPYSDFRFINWTLEDNVVSEEEQFTYIVGEEDLHFVAHFEYTPIDPAEPGEQHFSRTLSLKSNPEGGGSLYGAGTMLDGTRQRVYTNPNSYYTFLNWTDDEGEVVSEERDFYYTMPNRNVTLTANFSYDYNPGNPGEPGVPNPPSSVGENMVAFPRFGMYDDTHVIILCETEGSTIHYTLDGSDPNEDSPVYTEPVFVGSNLLVKAIAYKEGMENSPIRSYRVTTYRVAAPIFYLENKQIVIASETPDAIIRFTTDFSEPNEESEVFTAPFVPEENCRIKAYASKEGLTDSRVSIFVYRRADYTISAPTFELNDDGKLVITAPVEGAVIHYTTDGADPDEESATYAEPLTLDGNGVIKAYATHINYYDSPISEYTVEGFRVEPPVVDFLNPVLKFSTPTANAQIRYTTDGTIPTEESDLFPDEMRLTEDAYVIARGFKDRYIPSETTSFTYVYNDYLLPTPTASFANRVLTLTCEDPEAQIHYTTDDSEPTASSTLYEGPISLSEDCTVRFIATREHFNDSPSGSFVFVLVTYRVETPAFNYDAVNKTMTMTCATEDAVVRYTTDGTVPEENTGTLYEGPVEVTGNLTFTARGFRNDLFPSTPAVLSINDQSVPTPTASFANLRLTLTCEDTEASIYYTTDGSTPTEQSTLYTDPVELTEDCTVRFIGMRENFNNSPVGSYNFVRSYFAVAKPTFTYDTENRSVGISTETEGAEIRYTTDGTEPTETTGIVFTDPIEIVGNHTFTARAFKENFFGSEAATLTIDDQKVPAPVASFANRVLTITCPDAHAAIYYTTDGTEPSAASTLYESPVSLTSDCTVRAIAIRENFINSDVTVFNFVYDNYRVAQPSLSYNPADKTVAMRCATENVEIRYTTDGSVPTPTTGTVYSDPVAVVGNQTFTVRGFRNDLFDSESAVLEITDQTVPTPTASFSDLRLTLTCEDPAAAIYYTTDGSTPTGQSNLYTAPVALTQDCVVSFIAVRENFNNSPVGSYDFVRANFAVATPVISYNSEEKTMTITSETEGAQIRYTTDGTEPTATTGTLYEGSFTVVGNQTFIARAFKENLFESEIASLAVTDQTVPTPTASFADLRLTIVCADPEATIYYTTDGNDPTAESTLYAGPIELTENCTVKFIAVRENFNNSPVGSYDFVRANFAVATPVFAYNTEEKTMTITSATEGAQIRYTTDGTEPTATTGTLYEGSFIVVGNQTFIARAFRENFFESDIATREVTDQMVPTPTVSFADLRLTIVCADPEATIYYTTDGNDPTAESTLYTGPIGLTEDCTVNFIAVRENFNNSHVGSYDFVRSNFTVATPVFSYNSENKTMTISSETEGAQIRYTTDGTEPTATTGTLYQGAFTVVGNQSFIARAFRENFFESDIATREVTDQMVPTPTASFTDLRLTIVCADPEVTIYYTTDGNDPTAESTLYAGPVELTENCTVKFIAVRENFNNSHIGTYDFVRANFAVATPLFTYDTDNKTVAISTETEGAVIRYTTDGSDPEENNGIEYSAPVEVVGNMTFKARAFKENMFESEIATLQIDDQKVPTPVASFANRVLTISCPDPLAQIHYTIGEEDPTETSPEYTQPLELTEDCTVWFIATRDNFNNSEVDSFEFVYNDYRVATPALNYDSGSRTITMGCPTEGAEIRYTTDGTVPTASTGTVYSEPIVVVGNQTFTAVAFRTGLFDSEVATCPVTDQTVPTPTASFANKVLTLSCSDPLAKIHYSIGEEDPTEASPEYTQPIELTEDCTVWFIATRDNFNNSDVDSFEFVYNDYRVATPALNYDSGSRILTMGCSTEGAEIRYTTDGSVPTASTGTVYSEPIVVVGNQTFTAVAFRTGLFDSEVATCPVTDQTVPTPTASFANKVLTLSCSDPLAQIHYSIGEEDPTETSPEYTQPIELTEDCTVKFIATRDNFNNSDMDSFEFVYNDHRVATPALNYDSASRILTMGCSTEGAEIRYTTDGTVPTASTGTVYSEPIVVVGNQTFTAVAFRDDLFDSEPATLPIIDHYVPNPTASFANRVLTLSCSDPLAQIHYSIGNSEPTEESTLYEGPIALTEDCTVRFIATRDRFNNSEVEDFEFVYERYRVARPTLNYDSGSRTMTMGCSTEGAEIRYTTDGSVPTTTTGTVYTAPFIVVGNQTFTAVAFRNDLFDSAEETKPVDDQAVRKPEAEFSNLHLILTCEDEGARIYYTFGDSTPTEQSTLYEGPVALTTDCIVNFIGVLEKFNNSPVGTFTFVRSNYAVATPTFTFDRENLTVYIETETEGASIRYTTDGTDPTATNGIAYEGPIKIFGNLTIKARGFKEGMFESEVATLPINDLKVRLPQASFGNRVLTLSCPDAQATILYTLDGSDPIRAAEVYVNPLPLTENCVVRFIAVREGFHNSDENQFNFEYAKYQVATPELNYDPETRFMEMTCATEGAEIRYTTDGSVPTASTGTVYTEKVFVIGNLPFKAVAFRSDLFDSAPAEFTVTDQGVDIPTARYSNHTVILECEDTEAEIRYIINGEEVPSETYEEPIPVDSNCTIRFMAVRNQFNNSPIGSYDFKLADYQEKMPEFNPDYRNRKVTVTQKDNLNVRVTIGGNTATYSTPAEFDVTPETGTILAVAVARDQDNYDSETESQDLVFHLAPEINYNGHNIVVTPRTGDPESDAATFNVTFNDQSLDVTGNMEIEDFGTVIAIAESDKAFRSEPASREIDFFNTGTVAGARNGHRLAEGFGKWGDEEFVYDELEVVGEITKEDLSFIATLPALATLTLHPEEMPTEPCESVFADTRIETITLTGAPEGILREMPRLTTVVWESDEAMAEEAITDAANPNLLLWVNDKSLAPGNALNVVTDTVIDGTLCKHAETIRLQAGFPFNAHREFSVGHIELTKQFDQTTAKNICRGWETIAMPFDPKTITHESKGEITPYSAWDGNDDSPKPFWLYRVDASDWQPAEAIEANVPYIISMPNNPDYIEAFNLNGKITFAADNVILGSEDSVPIETEWIDGMWFNATYMPVDGEVLSLNVPGMEGDDLPGSVFTLSATTLPFGAYVVAPDNSRKVPVFGDSNGITLPTITDNGIVVETIGIGTLRISSTRSCTIGIYTPTGVMMRRVDINAGESVIVDDLAKGIYIVAGCKVMVN